VFHPKTYLAVTPNRATLLVGSGNLSTSGLDDGYEVFTTFRSGLPVGDAAIAAWTAWMRRLVELAGDLALAKRFRDLETRIPDRATSLSSAPPPYCTIWTAPSQSSWLPQLSPVGAGLTSSS